MLITFEEVVITVPRNLMGCMIVSVTFNALIICQPQRSRVSLCRPHLMIRQTSLLLSTIINCCILPQDFQHVVPPTTKVKYIRISGGRLVCKRLRTSKPTHRARAMRTLLSGMKRRRDGPAFLTSVLLDGQPPASQATKTELSSHQCCSCREHYLPSHRDSHCCHD